MTGGNARPRINESARTPETLPTVTVSTSVMPLRRDNDKTYLSHSYYVSVCVCVCVWASVGISLCVCVCVCIYGLVWGKRRCRQWHSKHCFMTICEASQSTTTAPTGIADLVIGSGACVCVCVCVCVFMCVLTCVYHFHCIIITCTIVISIIIMYIIMIIKLVITITAITLITIITNNKTTISWWSLASIQCHLSNTRHTVSLV